MMSIRIRCLLAPVALCAAALVFANVATAPGGQPPALQVWRAAGQTEVPAGARLTLAPGADLAAAAEVARHVQEAIHQLALPHEGAPHGIVTVSFGVASLQPQRDQLPEELVRRADRAMYRAKQGGRNRIELAPA